MITAGFALACALLVYAGAVKAVEATAPVRSRLLGAFELAVGAGALVTGGTVAAAIVAVLYVSFAVYVVLAIRRGAESCGCFGVEERTPPRRRHVVIDTALAVMATAAAVTVTAAPVTVALDTTLNGAVYALFLISATGMTAAALNS